MANIAEGYVCIESNDKDLISDLKEKISQKNQIFSYGGPVDIMEGSIDGTDYLEAHFTGRWSCDSAWSFFDDLIKDPDYKHQQALIDSQIEGKETEDGAEESRIKWFKLPGEEALPTI